jgi:hypothetical protein
MIVFLPSEIGSISVWDAGHPRKLPGFAENAPPSLQKLMKSDPSLKAYVDTMQAMENGKK